MKRMLTMLALTALFGLDASASPQAVDFEGADALNAWSVKGDVALDSSRTHGGRTALKVAPGAMATLKLRPEDGAGKVTVRVYEDGAKRGNEKTRGAGPLVGLVNARGRVLTVGAVYAPYLSGNTSYSVSEYDPTKNEAPWYGVTYIGLHRDVGWHEWTFDFDARKGLVVYHNGKAVTRYKYAQANSNVQGFCGVVVIGDRDKDNPQTAFVDDISVTLGGKVEIDLLKGLVPEQDEAVTAPREARIVPELMGQHPRLLFGKEAIAPLRAFARTPTGQSFVKQMGAYLPACVVPNPPKFLTDATDGQRQGLWRLPTVALHYVLTGDRSAYDRTVAFMKLLLGMEHWETHELDSGMSAANVMIGAALAYDWLYHDLDPTFREQYRKKLWEHARRQYYLGHLGKAGGIQYWQGDPQNNHRWHRNAGMALCALAAYTGSPGQQWMMKTLYDEMKYVADWLPADGTSHESPGYMIFGAAHLTLGMHAMDRCIGTSYLKQPFFANVPSFMIQTMTPGLSQRLHYGDQGGTTVGPYNYDVFELKGIGTHRRGDLLALADERLKRDGVGTNIAWLGLIWYPRELRAMTKGHASRKAFFADLGVAFMRDTWEAGGRAAMFKCGPFGGYQLNKFSHANGMKYVNVAHDDPDANSFLLFAGNEFVAESDRYSAAKKSANLNTILVNGIGQTVAGRTENVTWWQPGGDMSEIAVVTALAREGEHYAIEGEAAGSYPANPRGGKRPALDRYRRAFLWLDGRYVLVLDDIRAPSAVDLSWLIQSGAIDIADAEALRFSLRKGEAACPMHVATTVPLTPTVVDSPADNKKKLLGWKQLRLETHTATIRIASVYDLWSRGDISISLEPVGDDRATVTVTGDGLTDTWRWTAGGGRFGPSDIAGKGRDGEVLITLCRPEPETRKLIQVVKAASSP